MRLEIYSPRKWHDDRIFGSKRVFLAISLNSFSNQCETGALNPSFFLYTILLGNLPAALLLKMYFLLKPLNLRLSGIVITNSTSSWSRKGILTSREWAILARSTFVRMSSVSQVFMST